MQVTYQGTLPVQAKQADAGYDLCSLEEHSIAPGSSHLIKTGFAMQMPEGYAGLVCSRSGLALKHRVFVLNAPGIVDAGYTGDVGVILFNAGDRWFDVAAGDRVAQLVFVRVEHPEFVQGQLGETDRGANGFGSTDQIQAAEEQSLEYFNRYIAGDR